MADYRAPGGYVEERDFVVKGTGGRAAETGARWQRTAVRVDEGERVTRLSLAVRLTDAFTGGRVRGSPRVAIRGREATPVRNLSGHHVFFDLPVEGVVTVDVAGGPRYEDAERTVFVPTEAAPTPPGDEEVVDPTTAAVDVSLVPTPSYPFPTDATLLRGYVVDERGDAPEPVVGASVAVEGLPPERSTATTDGGEFAVFFEGVPDVAVTLEDGQYLLKVAGKDPKVTVDPGGDLDPRSDRKAVVAGRTTVFGFRYR